MGHTGHYLRYEYYTISLLLELTVWPITVSIRKSRLWLRGRVLAYHARDTRIALGTQWYIVKYSLTTLFPLLYKLSLLLRIDLLTYK